MVILGADVRCVVVVAVDVSVCMASVVAIGGGGFLAATT